MAKVNRNVPISFRKALFIGLGGSGQKMLVHLKRLFLDEFGQVPPCVKFLCIDTSNKRDSVPSLRTGDDIEMSPNEFIHLVVPDPIEYIESSKTVRDWLILPMPKGAIRDGTGAVRQNGRIALYCHMTEVYSKIKELFNDLFAADMPRRMKEAGFELINRNPEICITSSLAGGTGSGTFIDVGVMCRQITKGHNGFVTGVFLMPWIYRNKPATFRTPANTYAALSEIDMLMSRTWSQNDADAVYKVVHEGHAIKVDESPYTLFHIIDGRNEFGENIDNADALASAIANATYLNLGALGMQAGDHIDNILTGINNVDVSKWEMKAPRYTSFGMSTLVYPAEHYHAVLAYRGAARLAERAQEDSEHQKGKTGSLDSLEASVRPFLLENKLTAENRQQFLKEFVDLEMVGAHFEFDESFSYSDKNILDTIRGLRAFHIDSHRAEVQAQLKRNGKAVLQRLQGRLNGVLRQYHQEEKAGKRPPNFTLSWAECVADTLESNRNALLEESTKIGKEIERLEAGEQIEEQSIKSAPHGMLRRQRRAACAKYAVTINERCRLQAEHTRMEEAAETIRQLIAQLSQAVSSLMKTTENVSEIAMGLHRLKDQFIARAQLLISEHESRRNDPFVTYAGQPYTVYWPDGQAFASAGPEIPMPDYEAFKERHGIATGAYYANKSLAQLEQDFLEFARNFYQPVLDTTLDDVLEIVEKDQEGYTAGCVSDLVRLSSALWRYRRGKITSELKNNMCNVIVCGAYDRLDADHRYGEHIAIHTPRFEPSWVSTRDPYRIHLLQYAVSVPAFFLEDMDKYRREYDATLIPATHIDKWFQFEAPSLFPESAAETLALRVVTLGIIKGIGVIKDRKKTKGHEYTIDYEELNDPLDPVRLNDFIALREYVASNLKVIYVLGQKIVTACQDMEADALKTILTQHLKDMERRFKSTKFTKQITGRLYAQEIKILKRVLIILERDGDLADYLGVKGFMEELARGTSVEDFLENNNAYMD